MPEIRSFDTRRQTEAARGHSAYPRHYPQDQRWLDRLDTAGFAMWEETLGPGVTVNDLQEREGGLRTSKASRKLPAAYWPVQSDTVLPSVIGYS